MQKSVISTLEQMVGEMGDANAKAALARIKAKKMVEEVENALVLAEKGGDAGDMLLNRLRDLRLGLDEVEAAMEWPALVKNTKKIKKRMECR